MAGAKINKIFNSWNKRKKDNETQLNWRGRMFCFWYYGDEPLLTIGPDFKFSVFELVFFNLMSLLPIRSLPSDNTWFKITVGLTCIENISFILTALWNPKLSPQDPYRNSLDYLKRISNKNLESLICDKCNLIRGEFDSNVSHCSWCDVCIIGHDHHCVWCSKCIGKGNLPCFKVFLTVLIFCLIIFWINILSIVAGTE